VDRAEEHLYCHALLHSNSLPHSHPNLDAYAEQHAASHLYCFPDSHAASHNNFNTHKNSASYVDSLPDAHPRYTEPHLDFIADAHAAFHAYPILDSHTHLHANKNANALKF
jgi:hypothetical protein